MLLQEDERGFVAKVSDFGLSQLQPDRTPSTGTAMASAGEPAGTVAYMAPETLCYANCSWACDVYAFGILGEQFTFSACTITKRLLTACMHQRAMPDETLGAWSCSVGALYWGPALRAAEQGADHVWRHVSGPAAGVSSRHARLAS